MIRQVRDALTSFMEQKGLRKTPERYAVLEMVYQMDGHVTPEVLWQKMQDDFRVSKATVYSSLELLTEAHLVIRHHFGRSIEYEKCFGLKPHHHRICTVCGEVKEFHDVAIDNAIERTRKPRFRMVTSTAYVFGVCSKCQARINRAKKKLDTAKSIAETSGKKKGNIQKKQ